MQTIQHCVPHLNSCHLNKAINLIYPPATLPTSPYSSLPYLKGGLDSLDIDVNCFDLNVEAYNYWFSGSISNSDLKSSEIKEAGNYLKGDIQSFTNKADYNKFKIIIDSFFESVNTKLKDRSLSFGGYFFENFSYSLGSIEKLSKDYKDPIANFYHSFLPKINFKSKYIGISITYDTQLIPSLLLAFLLKQRNTDSKIILGGASILYLKSFFLKYKWVFKLVDLIIIGDGVMPIYHYLNGDKIANNCIYLNSDKIIYYNYSGEETDFTEMASPDYSCMPVEKYFSPIPSGIILSSLGCYYGKCAFCIPSKGKDFKYQLRPLMKLKSDITQTTKALNSDLIFFGDDSINISHLKRLFPVLEKKIYWQGEFRVEKNLDKDTLSLFSKNGCLQILFGLESAVQRVSDLMQKGIDIETVPKILNDCYLIGIKTNIQNIIGFPTETVEEAYKTASFLYSIKDKINSCAVSPFTLYQGSEIYSNSDKYGVKISKDNFVCDYDVLRGLNRTQSGRLSDAIFESLSDYLPANKFFLDGPMGNHAMIYYKYNVKI